MSPAAGRLEAFASSARAAGSFALDTEFMGEGRYRTLLCLIQVAVATGDGDHRVEVIDPLEGELRATPLAGLLADPAIEVVVHAGRQDIALMRRSLGTEVRNVFDTQIAAAFVGLGSQVSYDSLLQEVLGVQLAKSASFTRWDARPLSDEQLSYAREDAVHLIDLAVALERRLGDLGRVEWAREECAPLEQASDERDPAAIFARLPRVRGLNASSRAVARELVEWRERTAARVDRPAQSILADQALMEIARRKPASREELSKVRGAGGTSAGRRADELLGAVARGRERRSDPLPEQARQPPPRREDAPLVALVEALLRARAEDAGLAYELLASRADLQAIVTARRTGKAADVRTLYGWRRDLVGEELLELLDGRVSLSVRDGRLRVDR